MSTVLSQQFIGDQPIAEKYQVAANHAASELFLDINQGLPVYLSSENDQTLAEIVTTAKHIQDQFTDVIVVATGASNTIPLSISTLTTTSKVNLHYIDNSDHTSLKKITNKVNPHTSCSIVISKSGETIEVLGLTFLLLEWYKKNLEEQSLGQHFIMISDPVPNSLRKVAEMINAKIFDHPREVGGRFAVFSVVGLLIAAIVGFEIDLIIEHAKNTFYEQIKPDSFCCQGAAYMLAMNEQYNNSVFMIYGDQLSGLNNWHRQMIAESLGKDGLGINPMIAAGLIDQHSQLQLYLDGPDDKFYTILTKENSDHAKISVADSLKAFSLNYLDGKTLDDIMQAQLKAVIDLLNDRRRNIRIIHSKLLDEKFIAEFMLTQILEILLFAYVKQIMPFGQPAVEKIKQSIKSYLLC